MSTINIISDGMYPNLIVENYVVEVFVPTENKSIAVMMFENIPTQAEIMKLVVPAHKQFSTDDIELCGIKLSVNMMIKLEDED